MCLNAKGGSGRIDGESETFIASTLRGHSDYGDGKPCLRADGGDCGGGSEVLVAHSLRADGFDASEHGTGRGTPLVPVAFSCKDHGADAGDIAPTLRAMGHDGSHPNAGGQIAVAFNWQGGGTQGNLDANSERTSALHCGQTPAIAFNLRGPEGGAMPEMAKIGDLVAVRRLTPRECETLQGFPPDFTLIPEYRKRQKERGTDAEALYEYYCRTERGRQHVEMRDGRVYSTPDGPRYKALGNSIAVPVLAHIGRRIEMVEEIMKERAA